VAQELEVGRLIISSGVAAKIRDLRGLEPADLRAAVEGYRLRFKWDRSPVHGLRALVFTAIAQEIWLFVLYPAVDEPADVWVLRTAYPVAEYR
jgi:hypothetical protein